MKLGELRPAHRSKKGKRVGRGVGGLGKTCGRGTKGQKARYKVRVGFEGGQMPLQRRIPKRGFRSLNRTRFTPVNIAALNRFKEGTEVSIGLLYESGLIKRHEVPKLLAKGELKVPLTVSIPRMSEAARKMIEACGGRIL